MEIYASTTPVEPLTQGDIIDACGIFRTKPDGSPLRHTVRVIVLTQACDLANAKAERVLVAVVFNAQDQIDSGILKAAQIRDQIRTGRTFGLYFLPAGPDPVTMPESIVDLRDLHTINRELLESLIAAGQRPARLVTPFREHLAQHFAASYMRIALPDPYPTNP